MQQSPVLRVLDQCLDHRVTGLLLDAEHDGNRLRHEPRIGKRRQLHEPDAIGKVVHDFGRQLLRQPCLADAAGPEQRQQPGVAQQCPHFVQLALAPHERRQLQRQVVRRRLQRAQRGKRLAQLRVHELIDALRARQVAQAHLRPDRAALPGAASRSATNAATACDNRTWPPCAALEMRAARLTTLPK